MIRLIMKKELFDIITSRKFAITFAICSLLILMAFYVGARNYQIGKSQFDTAVSENTRQMEGLTDWLRVEHSIFFPPNPLTTLVTGISNDVGRNIKMYGRGELVAEDSRFNDDPIMAVFRFLDLDFIFQIVLSLFAILFCYNAVNGEKEQGTLRLTFSNSVPKATYILGKIIGSFLALGIPLLLPILLGALLLPLMGVPMSAAEWAKLSFVVLAGLLYFSAFLILSTWVSTLTRRSTFSFLIMLVVWMLAILIIPRSAVLLAGNAVDVLSIDEATTQKSRLRAQLWEEDKQKLNNYSAESTDDMQKVMDDFRKYMSDLTDDRDGKVRELAERLEERRRNEQRVQQRLAFGLARLSPAASFSLAAMHLAGTSLSLSSDYVSQAVRYQQSFRQFISEKTGGMVPGRGTMIMTRHGGESPPPIDPAEIPVFDYQPPSLRTSLSASLLDLGLLLFYNIVFFAGAFISFLRYDVR